MDTRFPIEQGSEGQPALALGIKHRAPSYDTHQWEGERSEQQAGPIGLSQCIHAYSNG